MEFTLESASPGVRQWKNNHGHRVVITNSKKTPVLASGALMMFQINEVIAADSRGERRCRVRDV